MDFADLELVMKDMVNQEDVVVVKHNKVSPANNNS